MIKPYNGIYTAFLTLMSKEAQQALERLTNDLNSLYCFRNDTVRGKEEFCLKGESTWKPFEMKQSISEIGAKLISEKDWGLGYKKYFEIAIYGNGLMKNFNEIYDYFEQLQPLAGLSNFFKLICSIELSPLYNSKIMVESVFESLLFQWLISSYYCMKGIKKNDIALILIGGQGTGKTSWLNRLCPNFLQDYQYCGGINPADKDHRNYLSEKFLINLDDCLDSFFQKKGHDELKNFIAADDVDNRKAYARTSTKRLRIANIVGSVNNSNFLTDVENRRYLCFEIKKAKWQDLTPELIENVWREVKHFVEIEKRSPIWNSEQVAHQAQLNTYYTEITAEQELLMRYFKHPQNGDQRIFMQQTDILAHLKGKANNINLTSQALSRALKRCGFQSKPKRLEGMDSPRYCYELAPTKINSHFDFTDFTSDE